MSIQIIRKNQQAAGEFNGGEILENKPIGFPREGGHLKPFSNLFYWSHAWSDEGSTIGLHPHQGFEILSFVMEGSIEHYDTGDEEWKKLDTGAAQIIRSGNGISHSEKLNAGAHMFQIWFDPDLRKSLEKPASYNDYQHDKFPLKEEEGMVTKVFKGEGSPMQMDSSGVEILQHDLKADKVTFNLAHDEVHSFYVVKGKVEIQGESLEKDDFFKLTEENQLTLKAEPNTTLFRISQPEKLSYQTYSERMI
ncbi:MAG: pirin family protein [Vicingaceae bacterium]